MQVASLQLANEISCGKLSGYFILENRFSTSLDKLGTALLHGEPTAVPRLPPLFAQSVAEAELRGTLRKDVEDLELAVDED